MLQIRARLDVRNPPQSERRLVPASIFDLGLSAQRTTPADLEKVLLNAMKTVVDQCMAGMEVRIRACVADGVVQCMQKWVTLLPV